MEIEGALRILGLTHRASRKEARSAYRRLAKTWHPDLVQGTSDVVRDAEERMKSLNAAYLRVSKYLAGRKSPPKTDKPWWWGEEPPPTASARAIRRPAWFRGFTFDDPSRFRDDVGDYIAAAGIRLSGAVPSWFRRVYVDDVFSLDRCDVADSGADAHLVCGGRDARVIHRGRLKSAEKRQSSGIPDGSRTRVFATKAGYLDSGGHW